MTMKKTIALILALILCLSFAACGGTQSSTSSGSSSSSSSAPAETYHWRLAVSEGPDSVQMYWCKTFADKIHELNPNIEVELFAGGQLGDAVECNEMCINGLLEFVTADPANMSSFIPEMQFCALHFFWPSDNAITDDVLMNSSVTKEMVAELYAEKGLTLLAMHNLGWDLWTSNRAIYDVSDFKGLKVRTMQSPMIVKSYELYGANPTPIPYGETYTALQLGTAEAEENPAQSIVEAKFHEVQDYCIISRHAIMPGAIAVNTAIFEKLPADVQAQIREAADYAQSVFVEGREKIDQAKLKEMADTSDIQFLELSDEARANFEKAAEPAIDYYVSEYGGDRGKAIVEAYKKAIADHK